MNKWILYSILATIFVVFNGIVIKYLTLSDINIINFMSTIGCLIGLIALLVVITRITFYNISYQEIVSNQKIFPLMVLFSISFILVIYGIVSGIKYAPNPGYVKTIVATNAVIIAVLSYYIFGSHISKMSILGILVVILGLAILFSDCPM